jgi:hypothetical protein
MEVSIANGSYYTDVPLELTLGKTLTFELITEPVEEWRGYFRTPDKYTLISDMPPVGAEYRILNNTDKPLYLNLSYYNITVAPPGNNHYVEPGRMVRLIYLGLHEVSGYMIWSIVGDLTTELPV